MAMKDRREAVERALVHHGVEYSPPEAGGRNTWLISVGGDRIEANLAQAEWFCYGLAERSRLSERALAKIIESRRAKGQANIADLPAIGPISQRYFSENALDRMENGRCPECGDYADRHDGDFEYCDISPTGVSDRLRQYRADRAAS